MIAIRDPAEGASFAVKVQPRASGNALTGELGGGFKLALTPPPLEGRAHQACGEIFANLLRVSGSSVTIASGENGRRKVIRVAGLSAEEVGKRLASQPAGKKRSDS